MIDESRFKILNGFLWPKNDHGCAAVCFNTTPLELAYRHCRAFDVVVQAGGCVGVWPVELSNRFGLVHTFEPDPENFFCLDSNTSKGNIAKHNAALGYERENVGMFLYDRNIGAHFIAGSGSIPVVRIDDLVLEKCDLIYLDIEGYEFQALHGAAETIQKFRPVVAIEEKGLCERYGIKRGDAEAFMLNQGYKVVARVANDVILVPGA